MRKNLFPSSRVQTRLITLVLAASLTTILLTGLLSFGVARHLLTDAAYSRLSAMRSTQAFGVKQYLEELSDHVMTLSEARMTIEASRRFSEAYHKLPAINPQQDRELTFYYQKEFLPRLAKRSGIKKAFSKIYPARDPERHLKYHYLAANQAVRLDPTQLEDAKDGSTWTQVHVDFHKRFLRLAKLLGYRDLMLVDIKTGDVVYSSGKQDDLGTNLLDGPYANSPVAKVFRDLRKSKDPMFITFSDFTPYEPDFGKPTMFVGTTVFDGDDFIGALIVQISNGRIDSLMTDNRNWKAVGMGKTGETYLVGEDGTFRSSPRFFLESPRRYLDGARRQGVNSSILARIREAGTPVLIQPVNTDGVRAALDGKKSIQKYDDYRGVSVVSAFQPIQFGPFEWALMAEIDEAELFEGVGQLARSQLLLAAFLVPAIVYLTLKMEQAFVRPIKRLTEATNLVSSGDYNVTIPVTAQDEFGELSTAFNAMSSQLAEREDCLKQQVAENERLLLSIVPGSAASRLAQPGTSLAEMHPNVSVLFAEIEGWNAFSQAMPAAESVSLFNDLIREMEDAGERLGVEKLQQVGTRYLAVSGISPPRPGHERRAVECGLAMLAVIRSFNQHHNSDLSLAIAVHAGPLSTGVLTGERLSFDTWGETVNVARLLHEAPQVNELIVSASVAEPLRGTYRFRALPPLPVKGQTDLPLWAVDGV